eukprot:jgi/Botrbrau1/8998/Bobra.0148s0101.1
MIATCEASIRVVCICAALVLMPDQPHERFYPYDHMALAPVSEVHRCVRRSSFYSPSY